MPEPCDVEVDLSLEGHSAEGSDQDARAVVERFIRSLKSGCIRAILVPFAAAALELLHELEKEILQVLARVDYGQFSLDIRVGPPMVRGIEVITFAHELAQVTIWIGHLRSGTCEMASPSTRTRCSSRSSPSSAVGHQRFFRAPSPLLSS